MIRCLPEDKTNGFFVSCFVRDDTSIRLKTTKKSKDQRPRKRSLMEEDEETAEDGFPSVGGDEEGGEEDEGQDKLTVNAPRKEKTKAQLERAKRKKAQQKVKAKKRKVET